MTVTASPTSITVGASSMLTWSSTNATSCTASGSWSGSESTSGTATETPSGAGTDTYTLTCTGKGGSANASATVTVGAPAAPTLTIAVSPTSILLGATSTLTWSSTNATACTASGAWSGSQFTSGSATETPAAAGTDTYTLTCTGSGGSTSQSATLTVNAPAAPTAMISVAPATITLGGSATLTWSSTNATACTASGAWSGTQSTSGTQSVTPTAAGTDAYELTCTGAGGSASSTATLTVNAPVPAVTISVAPTSITLGASATLTWSSTNTTSCTASGAWSGTEATSGTAGETPTAVGSDTYTLACTGAGGNATQSATLTVNAPASQGFAYTLDSNLNITGLGNVSGYSEAASTGALSLLSDSPYADGLNSPNAIAVDPQMKLLFTLGGSSGSQSNGEIVAFAMNPSTGSLTSPVTTTPAIAPSWLAVGPSGQFLYVSHHGDDSISAYSIAASGALTEITGSPFTLPASNCGLFCEATADQMVYDSQAQTLYVQSDYGWVVGTFTVNPTTGALTWVYNEATGSGPSAVTTDTTGKFVYVTNAPGASVSAYSVTTAAVSGGNPEPLTPITGQPFAAGGTPVSLVVEPTDHFLYVVNQGDNTVSAYSINGSSGALTPITGSPFTIAGGSSSAQEVVVDASGQYLYVVSEGYNGSVGGVTQFSINASTGTLTQVTPTPVTPGSNANGPSQMVVYKPTT
ncbi:MAG TPA: beta-propeller fold lactonase family protein [Acidobacteriaceae bacterium]|nr:beta-propeller fold lactonase family protein [Acidobacteriaceae bacterium]